MNFVEWTPDLDTGFHDIDVQHKQLVHHINEFYRANETGDKERISIVLFNLIASAQAHFEYEEQLMAEANYPLLEPHRRVHQNFVTKLMELHGQLHDGADVSDELLNSLDGWLFRHIKINDKGYINSVNDAEVYHDSPEYADQLATQSQEYGEVSEAAVSQPASIEPAITISPETTTTPATKPTPTHTIAATPTVPVAETPAKPTSPFSTISTNTATNTLSTAKEDTPSPKPKEDAPRRSWAGTDIE